MYWPGILTIYRVSWIWFNDLLVSSGCIMDRLYRDTWRHSMVGHIRKILSGHTRDILLRDTKTTLRAGHLLRNRGFWKGGFSSSRLDGIEKS